MNFENHLKQKLNNEFPNDKSTLISGRSINEIMAHGKHTPKEIFSKRFHPMFLENIPNQTGRKCHLQMHTVFEKVLHIAKCLSNNAQTTKEKVTAKIDMSNEIILKECLEMMFTGKEQKMLNSQIKQVFSVKNHQAIQDQEQEQKMDIQCWSSDKEQLERNEQNELNLLANILATLFEGKIRKKPRNMSNEQEEEEEY